jgi:hypothetical protein
MIVFLEYKMLIQQMMEDGNNFFPGKDHKWDVVVVADLETAR